MKKILTFIIVSLLLFFTSCAPLTISGVVSLEILKDEVEINEVEVSVGDEITLETQTNNELEVIIIWESSNTEVASVDDEGKIVAHKKGTVVVSAYVKGQRYITDSIFVDVNSKVEQLGVGSGLSPEDPIFIGDEGEDEPLEIYFIEMQHIYADSLFIKKGNVEILIDSGYEYDGQFVNQVVTEHCTDGILDALLVSHSDGDHIDGLIKALENIEQISLMVDYGGAGSGNVLKTRQKYIPLGMQYHSAYDSINHLNGASDYYYLTEEFYFEVLNTGNYITPNESSAGNGESLAVMFYYRDFTFFTAGDITTATEQTLIKNEDLCEATLYKASHHGSNGSNSQALLDILNPFAIGISCARANQYQAKPSGPQPNNTYNLDGSTGHPYQNAIERMYKAPRISQNLNIYWSAVNGTMKFTTYGEDSVEFEGSATMKGYYDLTLTGGVAVWNPEINDFENKVKGEENLRLHETKIFKFRGYYQYLPDWYKAQNPQA